MNALTRLEGSALIGFDEVERMAKVMSDSKLFGIQTPAQYMTLMFLAQAEGQHPATVAQDYDIIQGKPARKTHSVLARFQAAGGSVKWGTFTEARVSGTFTHPKGGSLEVEWTIEMAQRAGLAGKDNWKKTPRAMLRARVIAEGVRAVYPAALGGQMIVEEAIDLFRADGSIDADTGEMKNPPAPPAPKPHYSAESFAANLPAWRGVIESGRKSADQIIVMVESKQPLTDAQKAEIRACTPVIERVEPEVSHDAE